jgi:endonuclease-3 related protein
MENRLMKIYRLLFKAYGPQHWWPGESPFEVMVGAILTQNTSWKNVEKSIHQLKEKGVLHPEGILRLKESELASLIRSSGYFRIKAKRLKAYVNFMFEEFGGKIEKMRKIRLEGMRERLLSVNGVGPETADSILLYGLEKPIFVVDAYTKRVLLNHEMIPEKASYEEVQDLFMKNLPSGVKVFNEYHALLVHIGKWVCKKAPKCDICPLKEIKGPGIRDRGLVFDQTLKPKL